MRNAPKLCPADALEPRANAPGGRDAADRLRDGASEAGADRTVGVRDLVRGLDEPGAADRRLALREEQRTEPVALVRDGLADVARVPLAGSREKRREVERVGRGVAGAPLAEQVGAADGLVERPEAEPREQLAHLESDEPEVRLDHLGRARELRAQLRPLARDPDRARVEVARAHHQAALGDEQRRAERELVRAEQRRDDDVAPGLEAAVDPHAHPPAEAVRDECLLRLCEPELPRRAGVLDRGQRARARAAVRARDVDDVRAGLRDAGRDHADAARGDELHGDVRLGVDLLEVEDELREVLDRVDVVVRRRRDERDARARAAQPRDLGRHLVRRDLAALAGLRALGDLDLELLGERRVLGRDAEAARCDLLDLRVPVVPVADGILAALARVRPAAEPVHRDRDRLVRLRRERAVRHRAAREPADDRVDRLDLVERRGLGRVDGLEQVARLERGPSVDEPGEALVEVEALALHGLDERVCGGDALLQRLDDLGVGRVRLAALAELVEAGVLELGLVGTGGREAVERLALEPVEPDPADRRRRPAEEAPAEPPVEPDGLEQAGAPVAGDVRDAHLRHDLEDAVLERAEQPPLRLLRRGAVAADLVDRREVGDGLEREPRADDVRAVARRASPPCGCRGCRRSTRGATRRAAARARRGGRGRPTTARRDGIDARSPPAASSVRQRTVAPSSTSAAHASATRSTARPRAPRPRRTSRRPRPARARRARAGVTRNDGSATSGASGPSASIAGRGPTSVATDITVRSR